MLPSQFSQKKERYQNDQDNLRMKINAKKDDVSATIGNEVVKHNIKFEEQKNGII